MEQIALNLIIYDYPQVLTFFDDVSFQRKIEQHQTPFTVKKLNTLTTGIFTYDANDKNWMTSRSRNRYSSCGRKQHELLLKSWKLTYLK